MKRVGNLFEKVYDMDNLKRAHKNAKKGKTRYGEVKKFEENEEQLLKELQTLIKSGKYRTSKYEMFCKTEGKKVRKIYKLPYYPDRIVQWALVQVIEPYLLWRFTDNTYSAIPFKGSHKCLHDLVYDIKHDKENCKYCLKFDIKHYYQTIDHEILKDKYARIFKDKRLLGMINEIIDSINTADKEDRELISMLCGDDRTGIL